MKKIRQIVVGFSLILFCVVPTALFALSSSQAGEILKNFKNLEREMIFESDSILLSEDDKDILSTYRKLNIFGNIGDRVQSKREYLEAQNRKIVSRVNSLEQSVKNFDEDIAALVEEINAINSRIITTKQKVESNKKTIDILKRKISENTDILLEYLIYIYKKNESMSLDEDIDNLKTILLSGEPIDEVVNDLYFKNIIQVTGQQLVEKHRKFVAELYIKKIELEKDEDNLRQLRKAGVLEKSVLDDKRAAKQRLLDATKGQEALYQKYIEDKLEVERDIKIKELRERIALNNTKKSLLERYDCEFIDVSTDLEALSLLSEQCQGINKIIFAESRLSGVTIGENPFIWPVKPYLGISAFYRDAEYKEQFGTDHDAIDIVIPQGTDIVAPMDGYVVYIQEPTSPNYAYIALKHSDGLVTLYGHISESFVGQYDFVRAGEVFAKSGGEYGTPGAGVLTTGPHLHFVVYEDEEYVDPLGFLDISQVDYNNLPDRYRFKFLTDFKTRKGYEFNNAKECRKGVFCIEGDSELERQKYLLNTYAAGAFRNWDIWVEESVSLNIDPTFMMCVGLAESGLGRNLKTAFNVGNVGNTDSGSTYTFRSAREGIYWMSKTFNNRFLSQYETIDQLSRYGNKDASKPIYASSDFNWHNNITKCMSHVKGYFIPDDYPFRIN